jgi:cell wall-associated NlpC family hydrolase
LRSLVSDLIETAVYAYGEVGPARVDCYGLVHLAYREILGIKLPLFDYPEDELEGGKDTFAVGFQAFEGLFDIVRPRRPQPFDVLFAAGAERDHLYLVVDDTWAAHAQDGLGVHRRPWRAVLERPDVDCLRYRSPSS